MRRALLIACLAGLVLPGAAHAFPGANGKIVFSSTRDDPNPTSCALTCNYELYTINPDGSGLARLTNTPAAVEAEPAWSPDGQRIVFQRGLGQTDIYVVDADGSHESLVIADGEEPGFSPDGTRIVFRRDPSDPNQGMNTVNLDGTGLQRIFVRGQDPAWSPDGSKIAIQETCCGGPGIATINSDGSGGELILDAGQQAGHDHPNWSPDGTTVVYERYFSEPSGVYTVPRSGGTPSFLEFGFQPAWSPDGSKMVFELSGELYVMNADGTAPVQIPNAAGINNHPDWQPLRALNPFPRPGGGTPLITYLVPAYEQCTSPNTQHIAPLAEGSCTPPVQVSDLLTNSKTGVGKGFVRLDVMPGNTVTGADEADVRIEANLSDVRNASDQSDYSGQVLVSSMLRITDRASGFGGVSATVSDFRFDVPVDCIPTAAAPRGSDCQILTTADTLVPGMVAEGKRSVISTYSLQVLDAGLDGSVTPTSGCPPTCGTGDEERYLEQGTFAP